MFDRFQRHQTVLATTCRSFSTEGHQQKCLAMLVSQKRRNYKLLGSKQKHALIWDMLPNARVRCGKPKFFFYSLSIFLYIDGLDMQLCPKPVTCLKDDVHQRILFLIVCVVARPWYTNMYHTSIRLKILNMAASVTRTFVLFQSRSEVRDRNY